MQVADLDRIWLGLLFVIFLMMLFIGVVIAAAAWSVRLVINSVEKRQLELEGKFTLLIDILLEDARRKNELRKTELRVNT